MATIQEIEKLLDSKMKIVTDQIQALDAKTEHLKTVIQNDSVERKQNFELQTKLIKRLENKERQNNIIVHGIKEINYRNTLNKIVKILGEMEIKISKYCITNIRKLSKKEGDKWRDDGPVLVSLVFAILKQDIMRSKKKIKEENIMIKDDLSEETRQCRKSLSIYSKKAKDAEQKLQLILILL